MKYIVQQVLAGTSSAQAFESQKKIAEENLFIEAIIQGLTDVREGNTVTPDKAKKALDLS